MEQKKETEQERNAREYMEEQLEREQEQRWINELIKEEEKMRRDCEDM